MQMQKVIGHIANWLQMYLEKSKQKGFVIGISGGIDSAVTSTLCAQTGVPLLVLEMPIYQAKNQVTRAENHIKWLKENFPHVESKRISLTETFDALRKTVLEGEEDEVKFLSLANARARLRMTTLYYFAGINQFLVVGTGNKVEDFGVGFFTKYGDGGVDLSPIADLYKSEVYAIAKELGINQEIQNARPTDGLWEDNRTDEDQLGATYDELEWAMEYIKNNRIEAVTKRQEEVLLLYKKLHAATLHKIDSIPICEIPEDWKK